MQIRECPRCGVALPEDSVYLEELRAAPGRLPAYRLRHKRAGGGGCVAYVGAEQGKAIPGAEVGPGTLEGVRDSA